MCLNWFFSDEIPYISHINHKWGETSLDMHYICSVLLKQCFPWTPCWNSWKGVIPSSIERVYSWPSSLWISPFIWKVTYPVNSSVVHLWNRILRILKKDHYIHPIKMGDISKWFLWCNKIVSSSFKIWYQSQLHIWHFCPVV